MMGCLGDFEVGEERRRSLDGKLFFQDTELRKESSIWDSLANVP